MAIRFTGPPLTYEMVQKLTDLSINSLHQAGGKPKPGRHRLDLQSLESVVLWVAAHGKPELRMKICGHAAGALLDEGILRGATKKTRSGKSVKKKTTRRQAE